MPTPSTISRSLSDPNISQSLQSFSQSNHVPLSNTSSHSAQSQKASTIRQKTLIRNVTTTKINGASSDHSENLQEFSMKNRSLQDNNSTISPYYKGLTDSSLIMNRKSHHVATSVSLSFKPSFIIVKLQKWATCLSFPSKKDRRYARKFSSSSSSSVLLKPGEKKATLAKDLGNLETEDSRFSLRESNSSLLAEGKTLRERVSEQSPPPPLPLPQRVIIKEEGTKKSEEGERVFVWADKYRPEALKDFICNRKTALELQSLAKGGDCGNFIIEGLPGVGKRTMIWALLREAFGPERVKVRDEKKKFDLKGESASSIQVHVKVSSQHVEVNLSELKGYGKNVIVQLIKETNERLASKALQCNHDNCRAIIIYQADKLSTDAQLYIRWLLERYKGCNSVFFCCTNVSKLEPVESLCTVVRLLPPSSQEIVEVLEFIAKQEAIELPREMAEKIAKKSKNNLRQAIRSFEVTWKTNYSFKEDQEIMTGWEDNIANIAKSIVEDQSPRQLYVIRGKVQTLIEHDVAPEFIFKTLIQAMKKHLDGQPQIQTQIENLYKEHNIDDDNEKPFAFDVDFMKIEECIAKLMSRYKSSAMKNKSV